GVAFRQFGHSGLLTPYGRFDLRQSTPLYAAGLRLTTTRHLSLGLESTFTPPAANSTPATYNLRLTGSLRF
ncbi:MAG: hypothetical protein OXU78_09430, partial [Deltaproteobacteria bacterium]|nr:hypothetical protein [Deltaproteobacteria bacterium]